MPMAVHDVEPAYQGRPFESLTRERASEPGRRKALMPKLVSNLLVALAAFCGLSASAFAEGQKGGPALVPKFVTPAEMRSGALLFKSTEDRYVEAPVLGTDVDLTVSGPTARARVSQIFYNPTDGWVEAVYVYPLPDGGAVDTLKMVVGERVIVGDIKERAQARVVYEQAKAAGQKASLMEQERPNIFTNSVANIGPKETVVVQIEYQEPVHQSAMSSPCACRWSWRLAIIRRRSCRPSTSARTDEAGAMSRTRFPIARASSRRCLIRASMLRSIRWPSRSGCRPAFRSARSRATITTSTSTAWPTTSA
jgi:hypothetical protein